MTSLLGWTRFPSDLSPLPSCTLLGRPLLLFWVCNLLSHPYIYFIICLQRCDTWLLRFRLAPRWKPGCEPHLPMNPLGFTPLLIGGVRVYLTATEVPGSGVFNQARLVHNLSFLIRFSYSLLATVALNEENMDFLQITDNIRVWSPVIGDSSPPHANDNLSHSLRFFFHRK